MYEDPKLYIYQGLIQYLLDTTNYNLIRIANLSNSSVKDIRSIYSFNEIPKNFATGLDLIRLFQIMLELELKRRVSVVSPIHVKNNVFSSQMM